MQTYGNYSIEPPGAYLIQRVFEGGLIEAGGGGLIETADLLKSKIS